MTVLTRYFWRSLAGPYLFSFSLATGLLYIDVLTRLLDDFAGKGLPRDVVLEVLLLSLPHTLALTLPLAVLPAVLYTFSDMASASEIVAMAGGGVQPRRMLLPTLVLGIAVAAVTYTFNDRILPEANHRLRNLTSSIRQKSPTFQLRERAVNVINGEGGLGPYFLQTAHVDQVTNTLSDVVIHDMSRNGVRRTTYAESGVMRLNESFTDLHLRLQRGQVYEVKETPYGDPGALTRTEFDEQLYVLRGIGDVFEDVGGHHRGDREMSLAALWDSARARTGAADSLRFEARRAATRSVERALGLMNDGAVQEIEGQRLAKTVAVASGEFPPDDLTRTTLSSAQSRTVRIGSLMRQANQFTVEFHKKLVLAAASIIFVLLAVPIGIRFPRGGITMVISVSAIVLVISKYGLTMGEDYADRSLATPFWSMWLVSFILLALGTAMVARMGRWTATARDSGWRELGAELRLGVRSVVQGVKQTRGAG